MNQPAILCVDDERDVLLTLRTQLSQHFPDYAIEIAETADEALELVDELLADGYEVPLVIADQIPSGLKGGDLLIDLHSRHPHILKVMLTGRASAEDVGNVVNQGNLYRFIAKPWSEQDLQATVTEALRRYQQEQQLAQQQVELEYANRSLSDLNDALEQQLRDRTQQLQTALDFNQQIFNTAQEGIIVWDCDLRYQVWNSFMETLSGLSAAAVIGQHCLDVFPFLQRNGVYDLLQQALAGETVYATDVPFDIPETGQTGWSMECFTPMRDASGRVTGVLGTVHNVSDRKRAELEQQQLMKLLTDMKFALDQAAIVATTDAQGRIIDVNDRFCAISQYSRAELIGQTHQLINSGYHPPHFFQTLWQTISQGHVWKGEIKNRAKDGSEYWVDTVIVPFLDGRGVPYQYMALRFDVTERKQAEAALRRGEARLAEAQRIAQLGSWEFDLATQTITWSEEMFRIFGRDPALGEPTYAAFQQAVHPDDRPRLLPAVNRAIAEQLPYSVEHRIINPDGSLHYLISKGEAVLDQHGHVIKLVGTSLNITSTKLAEIALRDSEAQNQAILSAIPDIMTVMDANGNYHSFSYNQFTGALLPLEDMNPVGRNVVDVLPPEPARQCLNAIQQALQTGDMQICEQQLWFGDRLQYEEMRIVPYQADKVLCMVRDISDRKRAELSLQESQQFIQQVADSSPNVIYIYDLSQQRNVYVNREVYTFLGYTHDEVMQRIDQSLGSMMHPEDLEPALQHFGRLAALPDGAIAEFEYRMQHKNGGWRWFSSRDTVFKRDAKGAVTQILGNAQDITDRKQTEAALRESERFLSMALAGAKAGVWEWDMRTNCTYWSDENFRLMGHEPQSVETTYDVWLRSVHPEDRAQADAYIAQVVAEKGSLNLEYRVLLPNGSVRWLNDIGQIILDDQGQPIRMAGIQVDITDRKQAELVLQEREAQLAAIAANIPGGVFRIIRFADGRYANLFASSGYERLCGIPPGGLKADPHAFVNLMHPDDRESHFAAWETALQNSSAFQAEARYVLPSGVIKWIATSASMNRQPNGDMLIDGIDIDVTDRKRIEESLRASEDRFRSFFNSAFQFIGVFTPDGAFIEANETAFRFAGLSPEEICGQLVWDVSWFADLPQSQTQLRKFAAIAAQGNVCQFEFQIKGQDGTILDLDASFKPLFDQAGAVYQLLGEGRDISDRKRTEAQLRQTTEELDRFFSVALDLLCIASMDGYFLRINPAWETTLGYTISELQSRQFLDFVHPDDVASTLAVIAALQAKQEIPLFVNRYRHRDGSYRWIEWRSIPVGNLIYAAARDITIRKRAEAQLAAQNVLLSRIAQGEPLADVLEALIQQVEGQLTGALCSVLLLDETNRLRHGAALNLPSAYIQAVDGVLIGEGVGSCGTAATRNATVIVREIATDPLWQNFKQIALEYGLQACWSMPIRASDGRVLGTFGVYYRVAKAPQPHELEVIDQMANIAGIAIERDRKEAQIRQSEEQLRLTLEFTGIGAWNWHPLTGEYQWTGKMQDILELPQGLDNLYQTWCDRIHPADVARVDATIQQALTQRRSFTEEYRYCLHNGDYVWRWVRGQGIYTATGDIERVLGVVQDITDRKRAELFLQHTEERYTLATRAARVGVWEWNLKTNEFYLDPNIKALLGYSDVEIPNDIEHWVNYVHPDDRDAVMAAAQAHLDGKTPEYVFEHRMLHKDGSIVWILVRGELLRDAEGNPERLIGTDADISDRKQFELSLQRTNQLLSAISEAQTRFITEADPGILFDNLLEALLKLTNSEYGFIGEILYTQNGTPHIEDAYMKMQGKPYLKTKAITDIAWDEETHRLYDSTAPQGMEFHNLNTLFGQVMVTGQPIIANHPSIDPRRGGLPDGHPPLNAFLGVPFYRGDQMVGMVGIANRPNGYSEAVVTELEPFLTTCASTIEAYRSDARRKQAEMALQESEERYRLLTEISPVGIFRSNLQGQCIYANPKSLEITGLSLAETLGFGWSQNLHPDDREARHKVWTNFVQGIQQGEAAQYEVEYRFLCPDGTTRWVLAQAVPELTTDHDVVGFIGSIVDITDRKRTEIAFRKLVEGTASVANEAFFTNLVQSLVEALGIAHAIVTEYVEGQFRTLAFLSNGDFIPNQTYSMAAGSACALVTEQGEYMCLQDVQHIHPINQYIVELKAESYIGVALRNQAGETTGHLCIMDTKPITNGDWYQSILRIFAARAAVELERQRAQQALHQLNIELEQRVAERTQELQRSEQDLRTIFNNVYDAIFIHDRDGSIVDCNERALELHGATRGQLLKATIADLSGEGAPMAIVPEHIKQLEAGEVLRFEWKAKRFDDRSTFDVEVSLQSVTLGNRPVTIAGVRNISDRKRTETALQAERLRLQLALDAAQMGTWSCQLESGGLIWSDRAQRIFGFEPGTFPGDRDTFLSLIHPEDVPRVTQAIATTFTTNAPYNIEYRIRRLDGVLRWVAVWGIIPQTLPTTERQLIGVVCDITDRKQSEQALRDNEARLRATFDQAAVGIVQANLYGQLVRMNQKFCDIVGYSEAELYLKRFSEITHPDDIAQDEANVRALLAGQDSTFTMEKRYLHRTGQVVWANLSVSLVRSTTGTPQYLIAVIQDITDRKHAEQALRDSEARFQAFMNNSPAASWISDENGILVYSSQTYYRLFQLPFADAIGQSIFGCYPPDIAQQFLANIQTVITSNQALETTEVAPRPDGTLGDFLVYKFPITDSSGQRLVGGVAIDITDRKHAEAQLQEQEQFLRSIFEGSENPIFVVDVLPQGEFRYAGWNLACEKISGLRAIDVIGRTPTEVLGVDTGTFFAQNYARCLQENSVIQYEEELSLPAGTFWTLTTLNPLKNATGEIYRIVGNALDITDRKQAELALQESEERFRQLAETVDAVFWLTDLQPQMLYISPAFERVWGRTAAEVFSSHESFLQAIHPDDVAQTTQKMARRFTEEVDSEYRILRPDGEIRWIRDRAFPIYNEAGEVFRVAGVAEDITDRKLAEQGLRESEERFRTLFEATPNPIQGYDKERRVIFWNHASEKIYGYTRAEAMGKRVEELIIPPPAWPIVLPIVDDWIAGTGAPLPDGELQLRNRAGETVEVYSSHVMLTSLNGDREMYCLDIDLRDRKQAEQALQEAQAFAQSIADRTPAALYIYDLEHNCNLYSNRSIVETLGYSVAEIQALGADLMPTIIHPDDLPAVIQHQQEVAAAADGEDIKLEYRMRHADGTMRWLFSLDSVFKRDDQGNVIQYIGAAQDITDLKRLEQELREMNTELEQRVEDRTQDLQTAMEAAEAANRAKSTFLANMSHELRTPLNAILGFAQLLSRDLTLEAEKRHQLSIINRSGNHLLSLINDILEMSKIEAGRTTFTANRFDLYTQIDTLAEMFQLRAHEKGIRFIIDRDPALPRYIETDENKLRQVLINLLGNAIKFTKSGYVCLRIQSQGSRRLESVVEPTEPHQMLYFEVEDTGPGIDPAEVDSLFEPFIQSSNRQISQEGTGLGLPISRQFVRLLGGELTVRSTPGHGSTFTLFIPVQLTADIESTQPTSRQILRLAPHQPSYRILIAEDNETNRLLLMQLLQSVGFKVRDAIDGQGAVMLWSTWQPHLIWMDMRMPIMNGYEATRQIRARESENAAQSLDDVAETVIIALTASAFEEDRARVLEVGCNDFVRKPFREKELLEKMADYLSVEYEYADPPRSAETVSSPAESAFLVDELRSLPDSLLHQLHQATVQLDQPHVQQVITELALNHPQLANYLTEKLNDFDFEQILQLVQTAMSE
jgi:PAS domain S-box-containing protein